LIIDTFTGERLSMEGLSDYVAPLAIERIPDGTHWVVHEQPERVTSCIRAFIEP
jgi:pimeloyl-ACP methyl ester carboxylesterase